jgi:branched-chain amino acid transport system ATP-binding protein
VAASTVVLRVENLTVQYGALVALESLSWEVCRGEILGIIGPNGAGKSSCFAAVTNTVPHRGDVFLDDACVNGLPTHRLSHLGLRRTFQQNAFFGEMTVLENAMGALLAEHATGLVASVFAPWKEMASSARARTAAALLLEQFGIGAEYHELLPGDVPYGVQRLLSVVLSHGSGARVLLLDEPAAGLGGGDMQRLVDVLVAFRRQDLAVVVIEHHMDLIMAVADRIVVLDQGRRLVEGIPADIQRDERVLEAYLGRAT